MGLPVIKNDKAGGFFIVQVSNGQLTHKMRFHVPEFGPPGASNDGIPHDCNYVSPPAGYETSVGRTFYELCCVLRPHYNPAWQFSLAAVYANSAAGARLGAPGPGGGLVTPQYPCPRPHTVRGTSSGGSAWYPGQVTVSFPTDEGGRFSLRMISSEDWDPQGKKTPIDPVANGGTGWTNISVTVAYLLGIPSNVVQAWANVSTGAAAFYTTGTARSMIGGHDGGLLSGPAYRTNCMNKRVRRSLKLT